ncbi:ejaculatory bulb-specific protein 3-like isoform X3 [Schistocerca americana]|uniref:ejaculatory bulb-specific protein 3-like isoform X3 n=1 Tax=Schistocerca americana TaxID=7009 RepID=UPI001F4F8728|nr:ejaculatory bulb-specific protein 3-like isoform X3 [Schistocerca americana]
MQNLVLYVTFLAVASGCITTFKADVQQVHINEHVFRKDHECLVSDSDVACTAEGKGLKNTIWRLLEKGCNSCTDDELKVFRFMAYLSNNRPNEWQKVLNQYDPQGEFRRRNGAQLRQYGVAV